MAVERRVAKMRRMPLGTTYKRRVRLVSTCSPDGSMRSFKKRYYLLGFLTSVQCDEYLFGRYWVPTVMKAVKKNTDKTAVT